MQTSWEEEPVVRTQRTITMIVLGVVLVAVAVAAGIVWQAGLVVGMLVIVAAAVAVLSLYVLVIRPWHVRWGATDYEVARPMPGDDLVPTAKATTRAVSIDAEPHDVWPWLVQIGFGRAGWYSYDWIDNDGVPSAAQVLPDLQDLQVGDEILMAPGMGPAVKAIDPERSIVSGDGQGTSSWCLGLYPVEGGGTRLISRWRAAWKITPAGAFFIALSDPGAFIMEQKMLREIRDRVERVGSMSKM
jgi:hypothetical protein